VLWFETYRKRFVKLKHSLFQIKTELLKYILNTVSRNCLMSVEMVCKT